MARRIRRTGIDVIGGVPWSTHLCQFYYTGQDLLDVLVPYFRQGLADNEYCIWVTPETLSVDQATAALRAVVPALDEYIRSGQIEILGDIQWYTPHGTFDADEVLRHWVEKLEGTLDRGYEGSRLAGSIPWFGEQQWANVIGYEEFVNCIIGEHRVLALCTYSLEKCGAYEVIDVVSNHRYTLVKRAGRWQAIESSEHRIMQAALREGQERLMRAQQIAHLGNWELDLATDELTWSDEVYRIFGLQRQELVVTYQAFLDHVHPDDRAAFHAACSGSVREGKDAYEIEHRVVRANTGEVRWVHEKCEHVRDSDGRIVRSLGMILDITERVRAEEALRHLAERLRLQHQIDRVILSSRSPDEMVEAVLRQLLCLLPCQRVGVSLLDPEAQEVWLRATYSAGETSLDKGWRTPVAESLGKAMEQLARGERFFVDDIQALAPWSPLAAQLQAEGVRAEILQPLIVQGELIGALGIGMTVPGPLPEDQLEAVEELADALAVGIQQMQLHEQVRHYAGELEQLVQQRTAALDASEARFRTMFEEAPIGIILADPAGTLVATNPALQRLLGCGEPALTGACLSDLLPGADGDDGRLLAELLAGQRRQYALDLPYVRHDGEAGDAYVTVSLLQGDTDASSLLLALVEDITERKRAQQALIQAERLAIMGQMAASLAHEVNNPIQSVIGCLGLAAELLAEREDPTQFIDVAMEELERAARIVHRMRDLGRREEVRRGPAAVGELVEKVILLTQKQAQNHQVEVTWEEGGKLPSIFMVPDHIHQVFLNIVLNAIDAMPDGGELRIRAVPTEASPGVQISFTDTGHGIPPDELGRIFEAFHTTKQQGLGLGLHVSHNIIQEHGGWIDVQSEVGQGTTFTVWLPAH